jgi:hypothetical protein
MLERMRMEEVLKQNSSDTWGWSSTIGMANRLPLFVFRPQTGQMEVEEESVQLT